MIWTQSDTLALAQQSCTFCLGLGMRQGRNDTTQPCNCVFRKVFRICYAKYQKASADPGHVGNSDMRVLLARDWMKNARGGSPKSRYELKLQDYAADFCLIAKRVLKAGSYAYRLFQLHFLEGLSWRICCAKLGWPRGDFFHEKYSIEQQLGRAFRELRPYSLFPLDEYFGRVATC